MTSDEKYSTFKCSYTKTKVVTSHFKVAATHSKQLTAKF